MLPARLGRERDEAFGVGAKPPGEAITGSAFQGMVGSGGCLLADAVQHPEHVLLDGKVFKARQLCSVRGGGPYYDGLYYVKSATHDIKRGEYKQSFSLARGGTGSTVQTAAP